MERNRKPAGLRTHTLVCIGSTMFLLVAPHAIRSFGMASFDPTRIVHGVVAGGTLLALLVLIGYRKAEKALSLDGDSWREEAGSSPTGSGNGPFSKETAASKPVAPLGLGV